jgi:hypothetical protein
LNNFAAGSSWTQRLAIPALLVLGTSVFAQTYIPPEPGAVARPMADKLADTVSVKDFGARGDGITDDTEALRTAFGAARSAKHSLFIPAGNYLFGGLALSGGVDIYGEGAPLDSVLTYTGSGTALRLENAGGRVRNLTISSGGGGAVGIDAVNSSELYLDHVEVGGGPNSKFTTGVRLSQCGGVTLEHYVSSWNDTGVLLDEGKSASAHIIIQNSNFFEQSAAGVRIREATEVYIEKNWMEAFQTGILLDNAEGIVCANSIFIRNNSMVSRKPDALALKVSGRNPGYGIYAYNFQFEGNKVINGSGDYNVELRYANTAPGSIARFGFRNNLFSGAVLAAVFGDSALIRAFSENDMTDPFSRSVPVFSQGLAATTIRSGLLQLGSSLEAGDCDERARGTVLYEAGPAGSKDNLKVCVKSASDTYAWIGIY